MEENPSTGPNGSRLDNADAEIEARKKMIATSAGYMHHGYGMHNHNGLQSGLHHGGNGMSDNAEPFTFGSDQSHFDFPLPFQPNPLSILTSTDTEYINTFFDHPDHLQPFNPFDLNNLSGGKPLNDSDYSSLYSMGGGSGQHGVASQASTHQFESNGAYGNQAQPRSAPGQSGWNGSNHHMSAADFSAASTLEHFRSTDTTSHPNLGPGSNAFSAWGSIAMPTDQANMSSGGLVKDLHSAYPANSQHFAGVPMSAPGSGAQMPNTEAWASMYKSQSQNMSHGPSRNGSYAHPQRSANSSRTDSSGVRFGTDNNFTGPYYNAPSSANMDHSKAHNLMGLPLVEHAAKDGHAGDQYHPHEGSSRQNGYERRESPPSSTPQAGSRSGNTHAWGAFDMSQAGSARPQSSHKKGPWGGNGGQDFSYSQTTSSAQKHAGSLTNGSTEEHDARSPTAGSKRRKSSVGSRSPVEDSSRKKRSIGKKRETLSEQQKKENHIASEQKRRGVITQQYANLDQLIPSCGRRSGLSRAEKLQETVSFIKAMRDADNEIAAALGLHPQEIAAAMTSTGPPQTSNASTNADGP